MRIAEALRWFRDGERLAWRSLRAGTLGRAGLRPAIGSFVRPLTAPSRYPEYGVVFDLLREAVALDDPSSWLLDIGSPKLFSLLLAERSRATVVATDVWQPAIGEAEALLGGLPPEVAARVHLGVADAREPLPAALRPPRGPFAGAFAMSVIEHVEPDPGGDRQVLDRMADIVRPAGAVVISVPVDVRARSEYLPTEIYGRRPSDARGAFFQRVYDAAALEGLAAAAAPRLALDCCVICEWPDHPVLQLQPRFPVAVGFAGISFPLLAPRFQVSAPSRTIPAIRRAGDAILRFRRTTGDAGG
jgi:SAM-dependent methyltransferase